MNSPPNTIPTLSAMQSVQVIKELLARRSFLGGLKAMGDHLGHVFQIDMPMFKPIVLSGPDAARQILVSDREEFLWRNEIDPVTQLLRHGLLVEDGEKHDLLRGYLQPALQRSRTQNYLPLMVANIDQVTSSWGKDSVQDMLVEMRRLALLILMSTLFRVDVSADLDRLWVPILRILKYISPGLWLLKPGLFRSGYQDAIREMDEYLFEVIRHRRENPIEGDDMLSDLVRREDMTDDLIRDQLLTMLIAGHDTSTAVMVWLFLMLGDHPQAMERTRNEVDQVLGRELPTVDNLSELHYLDQVIKETLRLYPPIHAGNRLVSRDMNIQGCPIPEGSRTIFSIYLTHRDERSWPKAEEFIPERFDRRDSKTHDPFSYLPFGGGPRNCIGAIFAQIETKAILARILQSYDLKLLSSRVIEHMGATLEPGPRVMVHVSRRK
jgi:cytochrome P450